MLCISLLCKTPPTTQTLGKLQFSQPDVLILLSDQVQDLMFDVSSPGCSGSPGRPGEGWGGSAELLRVRAGSDNLQITAGCNHG